MFHSAFRPYSRPNDAPNEGPHSRPDSRPVRRLAAIIGLVALVAAACSSSDDGDSTGNGGNGGNGSSDYALVRTTVPEPEGPPVRGGRLVYAVESDTSSPWTPQAAVCAISCHVVMRSVFDPLTVVNADGEIEPFLAESFDANDDFTEWTFTARDGVTFHDGTPLDGAAIATNLEGHIQSVLTGTVLRDATGVASDGMTATITFSSPWADFPRQVTGQIGYIASPTWLAEAATDTEVAAKPIGTGPFKFKSYDAGIQAVYVGEANPDYWIEGLPYLEEIEVRALPNAAQRIEGVRSGQIDITHSSGGIDIAEVRDDESITLIETRDFSETDYLLLNVSNPGSALFDVRVRRALAMATDRELYTETREDSVAEPANGPFNPTQPGYLPDTGYPDYDPDGARQLVEEYEAENGPINIVVKTTTDPRNQQTIEQLRSGWSDVGIDTSTDEVPQNAFIVQALTGNFEAFLWRNHGGASPDAQNHWWHGDVANADSPLGINFGRIDDEVINEQLDLIRSSDDPDVVREGGEAINRRFAEQVYNLWAGWTVWGIFADPSVQNITQMELPSGNLIRPFGMGIGGTHWLAQIWKTA